MFQLYDKVVYPGHGVGEITDCETKEVFGRKQKFFTIELLGSGMKIMTPKDMCSQCGLRKVLKRHQINKVFKEIEQMNIPEQSQLWNVRYREMIELIKTGEFFDACKVLKLIKINRLGSELSFGERKMLDCARDLVAQEYSLAFDTSLDAALGVIIERIG